MPCTRICTQHIVNKICCCRVWFDTRSGALPPGLCCAAVLARVCRNDDLRELRCVSTFADQPSSVRSRYKTGWCHFTCKRRRGAHLQARHLLSQLRSPVRVCIQVLVHALVCCQRVVCPHVVRGVHRLLRIRLERMRVKALQAFNWSSVA